MSPVPMLHIFFFSFDYYFFFWLYLYSTLSFFFNISWIVIVLLPLYIYNLYNLYIMQHRSLMPPLTVCLLVLILNKNISPSCNEAQNLPTAVKKSHISSLIHHPSSKEDERAHFLWATLSLSCTVHLHILHLNSASSRFLSVPRVTFTLYTVTLFCTNLLL